MKIYIAALASTIEAAKSLARQLTSLGHEVTSSWLVGLADDKDPAAVSSAAVVDIHDVDRSDVLVLMTLPYGTPYKGGGRNVEFGYALGRGKHVFVLGDYEHVFCHLPQVTVCRDVTQLQDHLLKLEPSLGMQHMKFLANVALQDVEHIRSKEATYKGSWKRRGGVGAFMMLARKWDRLEGMLEPRGYDVFGESDMSGADGTVLAEMRDLRRYLNLVEAELMSRQPSSGLTEEELRPVPETGDKMLHQMTKYLRHEPEDATLHTAAAYDRVEDGEQKPPNWDYIEVVQPNLLKVYNVDRTKFRPEEVSHLRQLPREQNHHEWRQERPWFQGMYDWFETEGKWRLKPEYIERWS